jgi:hypothetical protein
VIDWINSMCRSWGRSAQRLLPEVTQSRPTAATLETVRQELLVIRAQPGRLAEVDDAVLIANALAALPAVPAMPRKAAMSGGLN